MRGLCWQRVGSFFDQEWMQIAAILSAALVALNTALLYAWPSPSIPILMSEAFVANVTMEEASYTTVIPSLASIISSPLYPYLMDTIGRRRTLLSVAFPQLISWILIAYASNIYTIYAARFLSGFSNSCLYATLPVYIGEISSPNIRGLWGNAMSCCVYFGICLMNIVGSKLSLQKTAFLFAALPVLFFLVFLKMPESPYYYTMRGQPEKALETLKRLRKNQETVEKEFLLMQVSVKRQMDEGCALRDLFAKSSNLKALSICIAVRAAQQFAGISAFAVYAPYLFLHAGDEESAKNSAIIYTAALTLCSLSGSIFLDKLGRRVSMTISCFGCAVILLAECSYFYLSDVKEFKFSFPYFPIVGMLLYVVFYSFGLGIIPNLILGELFASNVKGKALCILNIAFGIFSSVVTKVFQLLYSEFGMYAPFLLFSVCCFISSVFAAFYVPETSGKTLEEIQIDLKSNNFKKKSIKNSFN